MWEISVPSYILIKCQNIFLSSLYVFLGSLYVFLSFWALCMSFWDLCMPFWAFYMSFFGLYICLLGSLYLILGSLYVLLKPSCTGSAILRIRGANQNSSFQSLLILNNKLDSIIIIISHQKIILQLWLRYCYSDNPEFWAAWKEELSAIGRLMVEVINLKPYHYEDIILCKF